MPPGAQMTNCLSFLLKTALILVVLCGVSCRLRGQNRQPPKAPSPDVALVFPWSDIRVTDGDGLASNTALQTVRLETEDAALAVAAEWLRNRGVTRIRHHQVELRGDLGTNMWEVVFTLAENSKVSCFLTPGIGGPLAALPRYHFLNDSGEISEGVDDSGPREWPNDLRHLIGAQDGMLVMQSEICSMIGWMSPTIDDFGASKYRDDLTFVGELIRIPLRGGLVHGRKKVWWTHGAFSIADYVDGRIEGM